MFEWFVVLFFRFDKFSGNTTMNTGLWSFTEWGRGGGPFVLVYLEKRHEIRSRNIAPI